MSPGDRIEEDWPAIELGYDLLAYQRFLDQLNAKERPDDAYLFYAPRVRFACEPDDQLVCLDALTVEANKTGCELCQGPMGLRIALVGCDRDVATRILAAIRPGRSAFGVQLASGSNQPQFDAFLRATFGKAVFAPRTVEHLESRISCTEIVRFVGSPYEVQRSYWSNMADCRLRILTRLTDVSQRELWIDELRWLHVVALLGEERRSYYQPQSPLGRRDARPGAFYTTPTRIVEEGDLALLIDGPRVSAPWVGGRHYHEILSQSVGDASAMLPDRELTDQSGLQWGSVRWGLARRDQGPAAWFCPPRPITQAHWDSLFEVFCAASAAAVRHDRRALIDRLADWHWRWVRLHPFRCANQSLGMNIVNTLVLRADITPIPHLLLDQLALRIDLCGYQKLLQRAYRHWSVAASSAAERWRTLSSQRMQLDRFVSVLGSSTSLDAAQQAVLDDPESARLALLLDGE